MHIREHINKKIKINIYKIMCVCVCVCVLISHCAFGSQNMTLGISPHLLLCLRQGHLLVSTAHTRLAGLRASGDFSVSISHFPVGVLGLQLWSLLFRVGL